MTLSQQQKKKYKKRRDCNEVFEQRGFFDSSTVRLMERCLYLLFLTKQTRRLQARVEGRHDTFLMGLIEPRHCFSFVGRVEGLKRCVFIENGAEM